MVIACPEPRSQAGPARSMHLAFSALSVSSMSEFERTGKAWERAKESPARTLIALNQSNYYAHIYKCVFALKTYSFFIKRSEHNIQFTLS